MQQLSLGPVQLARRGQLQAFLLLGLPVAAHVLGVVLLWRDPVGLLVLVVVHAVIVARRVRRWSLVIDPVGVTATRPGASGILTTNGSWDDVVGLTTLRGLSGPAVCLLYARPQPRSGPARVLAAEAACGLDLVVDVGGYGHWPDGEVARAVQAARPDLDLSGRTLLPLPDRLQELDRTTWRRYAVAALGYFAAGLALGALLRLTV